MASNKIKLKKSSVVGRVPTTGDLEYGEVALNFADGKLYYKTASNTIDFFTSDSTSSSYGDADVEALVDSAYINLRTDGPTSAEVSNLMDAIDNNIKPLVDAIYDLGDSTHRFRDLYLSDSSIIFGQTAFLTAEKINKIPTVQLDSAIIKNIFSAGGDLSYNSATGEFTFTQTANIDSSAVINLVDSAYVQARVDAVTGTDSASVNNLIDAKIQVLDIADIVGSTGNPGEYLKSLGSGNAEWTTISTGLDSAGVTGLIDSAYIAARTNAGTDSATVISLVNANSLDSAEVVSLVDSAYVQARQTTYSNLSEFTNDTNYLDSTTVQGVIDATYIQANQTTYSVLDSADVKNILSGGTGVTYNSSTGQISIGQAIGASDSVTFAGLTVSGNLTVNGTTTTVNTETINLADNIITLNSNEAGAPSQNGGIEIERGTSTNVTLRWNETNDVWEFTNDGTNYQVLKTTANVDSDITAKVDATFINALTIDADTLGGQAGSYYLDYTNFTNTPTTVSTFTNDANYLDSSTVTGVIDATYIQANQDYAYSSLTGAPNVLDSADVAAIAGGASFLDSAETIALIDSAYVQARQDFAYSSLTGAPFVLDSTNVRSSISVTDAGGDGSLTYNSGTGVITYTGPSAAEVRAHFSAGTGVTLSSGQISIGQAVGTGDSVTFSSLTTTGNVVVGGNLQVTGTTTTVNTENLEVTDNMIYLNAGESSGSPTASIDIGFAGNYNDDGSYAHAGLFRDATDNVWKFFDGYTLEPDAAAEINTGHASFNLAGLQAGAITGTTLTGVYQGFDSDFTAKSTTDLSEGTNLYYTSARVDSDITAKVNATFINALTIDADTLGGQAGSYYLDYTNFTNTPTTVSTFTNDANYLDSTTVTGVIDATYIQANQTTYSNLSEFTNDTNYLDSTTATQLIDSAYIQLRQSSVGSGGLDSALVTQLIDSAYIQLRQSSVGSGGLDSAAANNLIDAKVQVLDIADIVGATGNPGEYLKSLGNGNASWTTISTGLDSSLTTQLIDSAYIQLRQSSVGSGGTDSASVIALINEHSVDSTEALALFTGGTGVTISTGTISIGQAIGASDSVTFAGLTVSGNLTVNGTTTTVNTETINLADNIIVINSNEAGTPSQNGGIEVERGTSTNVSLLWNETSDRWTFTNDGSTYHNLLIGGEYLDSTTVTGVIDSAYVQARQTEQDFAYSSLTGAPFILDSTNVTNLVAANSVDSVAVIALIDSAYVQARQSAGGGSGLDSAAANNLIDAKVQVLDVADIVGAAGNPGEYLKSQGNGNAVWQAGKILNNWEEVSTTTFTASIGDRLIVDTTSAVTITLPASASLGDEIVIIDGTGNADSNNITIARNGHNIQSFDSDFTIDISRAVTGLVYYNATQGWILTET
jgi:hypothetical protein